MWGIRKIILSLSAFSITTLPLININSCSKIKKSSPDETVKFNWDEGKSLCVGSLAIIRITNFSQLSEKSLADNMQISVVQGDSVKLVNNNDNSINDSFTLSGIKEGESVVTVTYTSILHLKITTGSFKIKVADYSKIKVNYNKEEGTQIKPFKSDGITPLNIGSFDLKDWSKFTPEVKSSLKVNANNGSDTDSKKNDLISNLFKFDIDDSGKITAKLIPLSNKWTVPGQFHVKVEDTQNLTNFKDEKGADFWLDALKPQISLKIDAPDPVKLAYNGSKSDYKNSKWADSIVFQVQNNNFDWSLVTDSALEDIKQSIKGYLVNNNVISEVSLERNVDKKQFILKLHYSEVSFNAFQLRIEFKFAKEGIVYGDTVEFTILEHRHGVDKTEKDILESKEAIKFNNNDGFDFTKDTGIEDKKLIKPFDIKPEVSNTVASELEANGYNYFKSVVLTKGSFDKNLKPFLFNETEDSKKIKNINDKIEQIDISQDEKQEQNDTGITLTASYQNNKLVLNCPGIKVNDDNSFAGGEYYIVNKFKDNKNNYQFSYVDFKWVAGTLNIVKGPIEIVSHLYSMPIKNNSEIKKGFNDIRAGDDLITGKDTGAGTIDNPLMLTENDSMVDFPPSEDPQNVRSFSKDSYRGYVEVKNVPKDTDLRLAAHVQLVTGLGYIDFDYQPLKEKDGKYYLTFNLRGHGNSDIKPGKIVINLQIDGQPDCSFTIYYATYIGGDSYLKGDFKADSFIDTDTSIFVASTASNRTFYLGKDIKSKGSIKDIFFNEGYIYDGKAGAVSTDIDPDKEEPDVLKNVSNITFGQNQMIFLCKGSYVFMASPNSGVDGYITFCDDVVFNSTNTYISASNKGDDPSINSSSLLLPGNLRNKPSTPIIGKKGITFNNAVTIGYEGYDLKIRKNDSVSFVATTNRMTMGPVNFEGQLRIREPGLTEKTKLRDNSLITNEVIPADAGIDPEQYMGDINVKAGINITSSGGTKTSLVSDKNAFNPHLQSDHKKLTSINIKKPKGSEFFISPTKYETLKDEVLQKTIMIFSDISASGSDIRYQSTLPNINIDTTDLSDSDNKLKDDKIVLMLARGRYTKNQTGKIAYKKIDGQELVFNYSQLENFYDDYTIFPK